MFLRRLSFMQARQRITLGAEGYPRSVRFSLLCFFSLSTSHFRQKRSTAFGRYGLFTEEQGLATDEWSIVDIRHPNMQGSVSFVDFLQSSTSSLLKRDRHSEYFGGKGLANDERSNVTFAIVSRLRLFSFHFLSIYAICVNSIFELKESLC